MLEGLLLRLACCILPIVTVYSLTHRDDTVISVIFPTMFVVILSIVSYRNIKLYRYIVSSLLLLLYIKSGFTWYGNLINILHSDILIASTNWIKICQHLLNEIMTIIGYLLYYVVVFIQRYGKWKLAFYFTACLLQTFLVVYLFHLLLTLSYSLTYHEINIKGWFGNQVIESSGQISLDDHPLSSPTMNSGYDTMYIGKTEVYVLQYELVTFKQEETGRNIVQVDEYGNVRYELIYRLLWKDQLFRVLPVRTPFCRYEYFRHLGEDVRLKCKFSFNTGDGLPFPPYLTKPKFYWMHDGSKLKPNDRFYIEMFPDKITGEYSKWIRNHMYYNLIESRLDIHIIENKDFGEYQLWVDLLSASSYGVINGKLRYTGIKRHRILLAQFILTRMKPKIEFLHVPVGGMVHLNRLLYRSLADEEDLSFHHKIDSLALNTTGDTDSLCPAVRKGCSLFMSIYFSCLAEHLYFKNNDTVAVLKLGELSLQLHVMSCICPSSYGEHNIVIYRNFYNRTSKTRVIVEIPHSTKFVILPMESYISMQNYTELHLKTYLMVQNEASGDWKGVWKYFIPGEETVYKNKNWIENALFFQIVSMIIMVLMLIFKVYARLFLIPMRNLILEGSIYSIKYPQIEYLDTTVCDLEPTNQCEQIVYDIVIINAEGDNDFVFNELLPFLEKMGLKICVPERDFNPGERVINAYPKAIRQSQLFITICSQGLVKNAILNRFVSPLMLTELFKNASHKKSLFLKYGQCEIPSALQLSSHFIDWTSPSESIVKYQYLNKWVTQNLHITRFSFARKHYRFSILVILIIAFLMFAILHFFFT